MGMYNPTKFRIDSSIFRDFTVGGMFCPPRLIILQKTPAWIGLTLLYSNIIRLKGKLLREYYSATYNIIL